MENVTKSDQAKTTSAGPNIIGNAEEGGPRMPAINFSAFAPAEEFKRIHENERLSLDQFARKVSNKSNLFHMLSVKGKFPRIFPPTLLL